jgi:hypothetical protein
MDFSHTVAVEMKTANCHGRRDAENLSTFRPQVEATNRWMEASISIVDLVWLSRT